MDASIKVVDSSAIQALSQWAAQREMRGRGLDDTLRKVMKYWVEEALKNVPAGDRDKVDRDLRRLVTVTSTLAAHANRGPARTTKAGAKKDARNHALRGTYAARVVAVANIYAARGMKIDQFYAAVERFINSSKFSVNLHRAGLMPARRALKLADRAGAMPKLRKGVPGSYEESLINDITSILVENWASSHGGDGIIKLAGDAFPRGLSAATARIAGFVHANTLTAARRVGFTAS